MNQPNVIGAAALAARLSMLGSTLGCPLDSLGAYVALRAAAYANFTRVLVPDSFDAMRLMTYARGDLSETLEAAVSAASDAGIVSSIPAQWLDVANRLDTKGLYTGIELLRDGAPSLVVLADASAKAFEVLDGLGQLGVSSAARTIAQSALRPLDEHFRATFGVWSGPRGNVFELISKTRFDSPDETQVIASRLAAAMRNLGLSDSHTDFIEGNLGMFAPAGTHDLIATVRIAPDGVVPSIDLEFGHLPSNFVLDVLLDFGVSPDTGHLMGRAEGILGKKPDASGAFWVDGLTLTHAGDDPPKGSLSWHVDADALGREFDVADVPADLRGLVESVLRNLS